MGYTHYWYRKLEFDTKRFGSFLDKAKKIIEQEFSNIALEKTIENDLIELNGVGEDEHENFYFPRNFSRYPVLQASQENPNLFFSFTKTAFKPYDIVVVTLLALAKEIFGNDIILESDGGSEAFNPGKVIVEKYK